MDILDFNFSIPQLILLGIFGFAFLVQVYYYLIIYSKVFTYKKKYKSKTEEPVSVIICAKNEERNLRKHLKYVLEQKYSNYEVVVVNDCSTDDTELVLNQFKSKYPHLSVSTIKQDAKFSHGKKLALTIGLKAAKNEIVILTDADCKPESENPY